MSISNNGEVILVGGGCGDPELLTLKAVKALNQADAVVYDALVNPEVLGHAPAKALRLFVGKRKGCQVLPQQQINELLVQLAQQGLKVVRLKGGDPLIFGRGGEEISALAAAGIPCRVVPGITAALGAAASNRMPLTHRAYAQAVTFVSAHRQHGQLEVDWALLSHPGQSVVIYMGLSVVAELVSGLMARGMAADHPLAIIAGASRPDEQRIDATLGTIVSRLAGMDISAPALVVMGECVRFAAALDATSVAPAGALADVRAA